VRIERSDSTLGLDHGDGLCARGVGTTLAVDGNANIVDDDLRT
jgi:hypothetical protein